MTLKAFFAALEQRTLDMDTVWRVNENGEIRTDHGHCPLSYQADTVPLWIPSARLSLKMSIPAASTVAIAADYPEPATWRVRVLRERLLAACRLED